MKPFARGLADFTSGSVVSPFGLDTNNHREWERGFNKGYFSNLERVREIEAGRGSAGVSEQKETLPENS